MQPQVNKDSYLMVTLRTPDGMRKHRLVHRLVLSAFTGGDRPGKHCDHKNGVRHDNRLDNLRWTTPAENLAYARERRGGGWGPRGEASPSAKLTEVQVRRIRKLRAQGVRGAELARRYGVTPQAISDIVLRKKWKHVQ